ncbi:MAG: hypothetical protein KGL39_38055 [Patescibacteria group bacterium]|nr:hypothetical protein [Patescibacteria group bacterium]
MTDWNTKVAWTYENWQATADQIAKIKQHRITLIYLDPRAQYVAANIHALHIAGIGYGIYFDPSWFNWPSPLATARMASNYLSNLGLNSSDIPIMFDLETPDKSWVRKFTAAWRVLRPLRATSYTQQPFQGDYIPALTLRLARIRLYLQLYYGDMRPAAAAAVVQEQERRGMPPSMVHPFYDGAAIPSDARDGAIFTLERIP